MQIDQLEWIVGVQDPAEWMRDAVFRLCWRQHGGSGLGITTSEAMDLTIGEAVWFLEHINGEREAEAKAIKGSR